jgi:5'-3' exonuclease
VDDIVAVIVSEKKLPNLKLLAYLKAAAKALKLNLNGPKTDVIDLHVLTGQSFDYLGYEISPSKFGAKFRFTKSKLRKYNKRIAAAFEGYKKASKTNEKRSRKLLVKRIRFLTGNTRLLHNRSHALTGIYFANRFLTEYDSLEKLDRHLGKRIGMIAAPRLRARLRSLSFKNGYELRRFSRFSIDDLEAITSVWRHDT